MSAVLPTKHLFDLHEWQHLINTGFFSPEQRAELIEGEIIDMVPIGTSHSGCVDWLSQFFNYKLFGKAVVRAQNPLHLSDLSAPQPDIALLRYRQDFYRARHPRVDDVLLIIEVADSSLNYDRHTKGPLYARHGIAEYWIVDLTGGVVEVYRQPENHAYSEKTILKPGDVLRGLAFKDVEVDIAALLG